MVVEFIELFEFVFQLVVFVLFVFVFQLVEVEFVWFVGVFDWLDCPVVVTVVEVVVTPCLPVVSAVGDDGLDEGLGVGTTDESLVATVEGVVEVDGELVVGEQLTVLRDCVACFLLGDCLVVDELVRGVGIDCLTLVS